MRANQGMIEADLRAMLKHRHTLRFPQTRAIMRDCIRRMVRRLREIRA